MNFPSEETVKVVFAFDKMPQTPEKDEIGRQYLDDEIGHIEFTGLARDYIASQAISTEPTKQGASE